MNIAIFGNTNNVALALAMELRRQGDEVRLLVNERAPLHRPENVMPEWSSTWPEWIVDVSAIDEDDFAAQSLRISPALQILDGADTLILNSVGPSLANLLAPRPTVVHLTGSDLEYYAHPTTPDLRAACWSAEFAASAVGRLHSGVWRGFVERQRAGIAAADFVSYFPRGLVPQGDAILDDIGVTDTRRFFIYFSDITPAGEDALRAPGRSAKRLRVFCGARVTWVKPLRPGASELDYKGTDKLIEGFARFCRGSGRNAELRLVEKGWDVDAAKTYADRLGISDHIVWLKEMDRVAFRNELLAADVVVDQLDRSVVAMAGLEAMAVGRPLIAATQESYWRQTLGVASPILHADSAETVCAQLQRLAGDIAFRRQCGHESREFLRKYWSLSAAAEACRSRLQQAVLARQPACAPSLATA